MAKGKKDIHEDDTALILVLMLVCFGLVMVFSTSSYKADQLFGNKAYWFIRQSIWAVMGTLVMLSISRFDYRKIGRMKGLLTVIYIGMSLLLVLTLLIGSVTKGSKRWLSLGPVSFQPSELSKVVMILFLASYLSRHEKQAKKVKGNLVALLLSIFIIGPVGIENASTSIILLAIAGIMVFVSSPWYKRFFAMIFLGAAAVTIIIGSRAYRLERLVIWMDPENHPKGLQTMQGLYAIGSGGLFGKGLGQSMQKMGFLPEPQNDMIFSIICEELGLFGALFVLLLFGLLLFCFIRIAMQCPDLFGTFLVTGVTAHLGIQIFVNISVVTNTIPNTGIPLPFISYGGSSLFFLLSEIGFVLSVARHSRTGNLF
ncbi:MAG: putative peptidoglycan glycosyltransferase FtsW [Lachnospiraceae bacterium]|nr:putative peptidoglycan glycosyltransferase FtsW [Lachnospiraceae bacterium]